MQYKIAHQDNLATIFSGIYGIDIAYVISMANGKGDLFKTDNARTVRMKIITMKIRS